MTSDPRRHMPLYYRLQQDLLARINSGEWKPGYKLPPEHEICATYGVSRTTARQALANLTIDGLLVRKAGRGTFVREPRAMHTITAFRGMVDNLIAIGLWPSAKVLRFEVEPASPYLADKLQIPLGVPVLAVQRLWFGGEKPIAIHNVSLPRKLVPQFNAEDFQSPSVIDIYLREGLKISHGLTTVGARLARNPEAKLLGMPRRTVVMDVSRISYLEDETPFEFMTFVARADLYTFRAITSLIPEGQEGNEPLSETIRRAATGWTASQR